MKVGSAFPCTQLTPPVRRAHRVVCGKLLPAAVCLREVHTQRLELSGPLFILPQSEKMMKTSDTQKHAPSQNHLQQTPAVYKSANEEKLSFSSLDDFLCLTLLWRLGLILKCKKLLIIKWLIHFYTNYPFKICTDLLYELSLFKRVPVNLQILIHCQFIKKKIFEKKLYFYMCAYICTWAY